MIFDLLAFPAVILVALTSLSILVVRNWRLRILFLAIQYIGVFLLVGMSWPIEMAVAKLVAGWMSGAILGMAMLGIPSYDLPKTEQYPIDVATDLATSGTEPSRQITHLFYLLAALLVVLAAISIAPLIERWIPGIRLAQALGAFILIFMGTLQLAFKSRPFGVVIGILTALAGFEILYSVVENSVLVAGFLSAITLGLAMIGSYLLTAPYMEGQE